MGMNVCDNLGDHLVGSVYVKYSDEQSAARALKALTSRYYLGRSVNPEYSPVTDFREATCRQFEQKACQIGPYCNFLHIIQPSRDVRERTFGRQKRGRFDHYRPYIPSNFESGNDSFNTPDREDREDREMGEISRVREHSRERREFSNVGTVNLIKKNTLGNKHN